MLLRRTVLCLALTGLVTMANAQIARTPQIPQQLATPDGESLVLRAHAKGAQIYVCSKGEDGKLQWTLKAPDATLTDAKGTIIGQHFAGPSWKDKDGSQVIGKAVAKVDSPAGSIPWLKLTATDHSGEGILARVTTIQRVHTKGGLAPSPAACTEAKLNSESRSAYTADYYFYAPAR